MKHYVLAPQKLPEDIAYIMHDFSGSGPQYVEMISVARPHSRAHAIAADIGECVKLAVERKCAIVSTDPIFLYEALDPLEVFFIPLAYMNPSSYFHFYVHALNTYKRDKDGAAHCDRAALEKMMVTWGILKNENGQLSYGRKHTCYMDTARAAEYRPIGDRILKHLSDENSFNAYLRMMYADPVRHFDYYLQNIMNKVQYFDYIDLPAAATVINCGIDTGWEFPFFAALPHGMPRLYALDPFADDNLTFYSRFVYEREKDKISFHRVAAWNSNGDLAFINSTVKKVGPDYTGPRVPSIKLDDFVIQQGIKKVDLIKMDIEGAEPEALEGARQTIVTHRPRLAICVYHGLYQFFTVPAYLVDLLTDYHFYFDTYNLDLGESVLYCIPKEVDVRPKPLFSYDPVVIPYSEDRKATIPATGA